MAPDIDLFEITEVDKGTVQRPKSDFNNSTAKNMYNLDAAFQKKAQSYSCQFFDPRY